ncbi:transcriptional regulator [Citrobacter sedlakii]|uniref:transcriptional regulator n=1 Tax=Citrobacter sedlakii TaxID=67826 RepID=UPI003334C50F
MIPTYEIENRVIFDPAGYRLWPTEEPEAVVTLYAPVSQCLLLMLQHPQQILSQEVFFEEVWRKNGLYVNPNTLYQNIALLRKALKSLGIQKEIIKTVPRRGIQFIGAIRSVEEENAVTTSETVFKVEVSPLDSKMTKEEGNSEKQPYSLPANRKAKRLYYFFGAIILICAGWLFIMNLPSHKNNMAFFMNYHPTGMVEKCQLFSSSPDKASSIKRFSLVSRLTGLTCTSGEKAWVTFNRNNSMVSVVTCDNEINHPAVNCMSWIYREAGNE